MTQFQLTMFMLCGWLTAIAFGLAALNFHLHRRGWEKLYRDTQRQLRELERKHLSADMDQISRDWYQAEIVRLTDKCNAICSTVRRLKGRGQGTCEIHPRHSF